MTPVERHPEHGRGSLGHGYVEGSCNDWCNNVACRAGRTHERCDESCSAPVRWDDTGGWQIGPETRDDTP